MQYLLGLLLDTAGTGGILCGELNGISGGIGGSICDGTASGGFLACSFLKCGSSLGGSLSGTGITP